MTMMPEIVVFRTHKVHAGRLIYLNTELVEPSEDGVYDSLRELDEFRWYAPAYLDEIAPRRVALLFACPPPTLSALLDELNIAEYRRYREHFQKFGQSLPHDNKDLWLE